MEQQPDYVEVLACARLEREVLQFLLEVSDDWPWPPIEAVMGAMADPITIASLCDPGLLRRRGEFVMITRAALHFQQIVTRP